MLQLPMLNVLALALSIVIWLGFSFPTSSLATEPSTQNKAPFKTSGKLSYNLQKFTGLTFASNFLASQISSLALSSYLHGRVRCKVKSYALTDMLAGKFKSIEVKAKSGKVQGINFGRAEITASSPLWIAYLEHHGQKPGLRNPVLLSWKASLSEEEANKALSQAKSHPQLAQIPIQVPGLGNQTLEMLNPKITLAQDKVIIDTTLVTAGSTSDTGVKLTISALPVLEGDSIIKLQNTSIQSDDIVNPEQFAKFTEDLLNPLVNLARLDRAGHAIRMDQLDLKDSSLYTKGRLILAPKTNLHIQSQVAKSHKSTVK